MHGLRGFRKLLYRQGVAAFEASKRKKFTKFLEGESSRM
jgi:hypothetical protein